MFGAETATTMMAGALGFFTDTNAHILMIPLAFTSLGFFIWRNSVSTTKKTA